VSLETGKKTRVRALKAKELSKVGEHIAQVLVHIYSSKGQSIPAIITSGSSITINAMFDILALTSDLAKEELGELSIADLIKVVNKWLEVNHLDEVGPTFFALKAQVKKIAASMPVKKPQSKHPKKRS